MLSPMDIAIATCKSLPEPDFDAKPLTDALKAAAPDAPGAEEAKALLDRASAAGNLYGKKSAPKIADPEIRIPPSM